MSLQFVIRTCYCLTEEVHTYETPPTSHPWGTASCIVV